MNEKSYLQSLPYDVFLEHIIKRLEPYDVYTLCKSSNVLKEKCNERNGLLYKLILEKYGIISYVPYNPILPYVSTTIWDDEVTLIKLERHYKRIKYGSSDRMDFVIPDLVIGAFLIRLKKSYNVTMDQVLEFIFDRDKLGPTAYHVNVSIETENENDKTKYISDISREIKYSFFPVEERTINGNLTPILLNNTINIIGSLKPLNTKPGHRRFLVDGMLLNENHFETWKRFLVLINYIDPSYHNGKNKVKVKVKVNNRIITIIDNGNEKQFETLQKPKINVVVGVGEDWLLNGIIYNNFGINIKIKTNEPNGGVSYGFIAINGEIIINDELI